MKTLFLFLTLLLCGESFAQSPPPILRNVYTTNANGTAIYGVNESGAFSGNIIPTNFGLITNYSTNVTFAPTVTMSYYTNTPGTILPGYTTFVVTNMNGSFPSVVGWYITITGDTVKPAVNGTWLITNQNISNGTIMFGSGIAGTHNGADATGTITIFSNYVYISSYTPLGFYAGAPHTYYVAPNGSDSANGTLTYPFVTATNAGIVVSNNATASNVIQFYPGAFPLDLSSSVAGLGPSINITNNTTVIGSGESATWIYDISPAQGNYGSPFFTVGGTNITFARLSIGSYNDVVSRFSSAPAFYFTNNGGTNILLDHVNWFLGADGFMEDGLSLTTPYFITAKDCWFYTGYDNLNLEGAGAGTNSQFTFNRCTISAVCTTLNLNRVDGAYVISNTATFDNCTFNITNNASALLCCGIIVSNGATVTLNNHCVFNVTNAGLSYPSANNCGVALMGGTLIVDETFNTNDLYQTGGTLILPTHYGNGGGLTNIPASSISSTTTITNKAILYRSTNVVIGNLATSVAVVFSSPFPSWVGTNYSVTYGADGTLAAAVSPGTTSKTTNGFTMTVSAGISGGGAFEYLAFPYQ